MRTRQLLLALFAIVLSHQVRSEDVVEVKAFSSQVFAPFGETVWLNCSTPFPDETTYETRLQKINTTAGPNWYAAQVLVDDWEESPAYCMINAIVDHVTIFMAYALPSKVTIDLQTDLEEGKEYTINCTVYEVAPLQYLTINIIRGAEVINKTSFEGPHMENKRNESFTHTFTARRSDNQMNFSCDAVLQLGPESHTVKSPEITALTYALPEAPVITVDKWIEAGTPVTAECLVAKGFPAENVILTMLIGDTPLDVITKLTNEGIVKGTARLDYSDLGQKTISCESHIFTLSKEAAVNVTFYENPIVSFDLSSDVVNLEENVTATCNLTNKHPEAYGLFISVDGKKEQRVQASMVTHTFTVSRRTPSLLITCTADITKNRSISQSSVRTLQVHYLPEFTDSLCPSTVHLKEGDTGFSCLADGNPTPTVECTANGHYINDTVTVTREMSGNYICNAANERGSGKRTGMIEVESVPDMFWIIGVVLGPAVILVIAGYVIHYCWKKGRKGFYELLRPSHHQSHQNGDIHPEVAKNETTNV